MQYIRLSLTSAALMLVLALPAFAGDIQRGFASTGATTHEAIAIDSAAEIALGLVQSLLSLF